jgi:subtilisin family serine protease
LDPSSAVAVLGFKYIFDRAEKEGKPCVINFSSCESITIARQRILEGEALQALTGPGRIIVAGAGNMGTYSPLAIKPEGTTAAGTGINYGIGGGGTIDMDIVTPSNQLVRFDFLGMKLMGGNIEGTITFNTDSVAQLAPDTCVLNTTVSMGEVTLKIHKSSYEDPRGDVYHVQGTMPHIAYLLLCGAACLLQGDDPAWMYSDLFLSPFASISGNDLYSYAQDGYSVAWPATLDNIIAVGATGYKNTFVNIDGNENLDVVSFAPDKLGYRAKFSSQGPTFDGTIKPDVVAPGMNINAPYNSFVSTFDSDRKSLTDHVVYEGKDYYYLAESGTSMACPVVAGAVALWLQANPNLTPAQVLDVIANTSTKPEPSMEYPNNSYGYGQIDAYAGLLYILGASTDIPTLSRHQPEKARFVLAGRTLSVDMAAAETMGARLTVYDLNGGIRASTAGTTINLSSLPAGVYAVQLTTNNKETTGSTLIRL